MNHYATYFDSSYLAQGLAMWSSLARHDSLARLWVLALDEGAATVLRALGGERLQVVTLEELLAKDPELVIAQQDRSRREFIFTLTPCFTRLLLRAHPEIGLLVYLDADLYFFASPEPILTGLGSGSILLVGHRFPRWHDNGTTVGRFNVGVLAFRNDRTGLACLDWWRLQCLESCALTTDGTHYGDQKYLDEWPARFSGVVELTHPGVNVAPWNWARHDFELRGDHVLVDGQPLVVFHFAQFRLIRGRWFDSGQLEYGVMPFGLRSRLYGEYWNALVSAEQTIRTERLDFQIAARGWRTTLAPLRWGIWRLFWGQFWRQRDQSWWAMGLGLGRFSGHVMGAYRDGQSRFRNSK